MYKYMKPVFVYLPATTGLLILIWRLMPFCTRQNAMGLQQAPNAQMIAANRNLLPYTQKVPASETYSLPVSFLCS